VDVGALSQLVASVGPLVEEVLAPPTAETLDRIPAYLRESLRSIVERDPAAATPDNFAATE
jgi:hypothetical protein